MINLPIKSVSDAYTDLDVVCDRGGHKQIVLFDLDRDVNAADTELLVRTFMTDNTHHCPVHVLKVDDQLWAMQTYTRCGMPSMCGGDTTIHVAHRMYKNVVKQLLVRTPEYQRQFLRTPTREYAGIHVSMITGLPQKAAARLMEVLTSAEAKDSSIYLHESKSTAVGYYKGNGSYDIVAVTHNFMGWDEKEEYAEEADYEVWVDCGYNYRGSDLRSPERSFPNVIASDTYYGYPNQYGDKPSLSHTINTYCCWYEEYGSRQKYDINTGTFISAKSDDPDVDDEYHVESMLREVRSSRVPAVISTNIGEPCYHSTLDLMEALQFFPAIEKERGVYPLSPRMLGCNENEGNHAIAATVVIPAPEEVAYL